MGIASLILGIIGLIFSFIPCVGYLAIPLILVGLGLGIPAVIIAKKKGQPSGLPMAGTILNGLALLIVIIWTCLFAAAGNDVSDYPVNSTYSSDY